MHDVTKRFSNFAVCSFLISGSSLALALALASPAHDFELDGERHNVMSCSFVGRQGSDDFLPTHWTLGNAFTRFCALVLSGDESLHEAGMAKKMT